VESIPDMEKKMNSSSCTVKEITIKDLKPGDKFRIKRKKDKFLKTDLKDIVMHLDTFRLYVLLPNMVCEIIKYQNKIVLDLSQ